MGETFVILVGAAGLVLLGEPNMSNPNPMGSPLNMGSLPTRCGLLDPYCGLGVFPEPSSMPR